MRFTFCFSRSCWPYPASILRRAAPCCPGGLVPRFSIAQEGLKHRSPFKNNFPPSRRHSRHTASLYLAIVFSAFSRISVGSDPRPFSEKVYGNVIPFFLLIYGRAKSAKKLRDPISDASALRRPAAVVGHLRSRGLARRSRVRLSGHQVSGTGGTGQVAA